MKRKFHPTYVKDNKFPGEKQEAGPGLPGMLPPIWPGICAEIFTILVNFAVQFLTALKFFISHGV
ncbi:hypothetical protein [Chitinophaga japonensis]|uniref:hypothetical protein n=1 Tax=Chitinophaga japonensis TaxID=104662 RepID=UPI0011A517B5|nr:hypothetical protein [Chitinophaga japonensis]